MQESNWQELDFKVASDYTHGSPEYYRSVLRNMVGIPNLLPGEKNDNRTKQFNTPNSPATFGRGYMPSNLYKSKG